MEQARAFERLAREFNMTQEQMAQRTGKDRTTIANYLRLLKLPFVVQEELRYNFKITFSHAKLLLMLDSEEQINRAAQLIVRHNLSVIKTEELVYNMRNPIVRPAGSYRLPNVCSHSKPRLGQRRPDFPLREAGQIDRATCACRLKPL